jgi:tetratricopeptide (TPR) repeat protein
VAITIPILTQFKGQGLTQAINEIKRAQGAFGKFAASGKLFQSVGTSLTKNITLPLVAASAAINSTIQAASSLQESLSKTEAVFGQNADQVKAWARTTSAAFGVNQQAALEAAGTYGNLFKAFGLNDNQAQGMSTTLVELAADMASFNNVPIEDALLALRSGLSGETEPLKRFGVAINDQRLKLKAAELGLGTYTGTLPVAIKVQAAYALIMQDTALQQGDVGRTSDQLANQQKFLAAQVADLRAEFGTAFLPIMLELVTVFREQVIPVFQRFTDFMKSLSPETLKTAGKIALFVGVLGPMLFAIGKIIISIANFKKAMIALNLTMAANPILLVVMAVSALIAIFAVAYKSNEKFRIGVNKIANAVIGFVEGAVDYAIKYINLYIKAFNLVIKAANIFGADLSEISELSSVTFKRLSTVAQATKEVGEEATNSADAIVTDYVPAFDDMGLAAEQAGKQTDKATEATKKLNAEMKKTLVAARDAAQVVVDDLEKALDSATSKLDDAKNAFNSFKDTIKGTVTSILNFGRAVETGDFLSGLVAQAADATVFADKIRKLIELGLSERALRQVLDAGFEAGSVIADNIIAGGATVVQQVNTLVDSVAQVADHVGEFGARTFYQAGITQGESLVAGIRAALDQAQAELNARIAALTKFEEGPATSGASAGAPPTGGSPTQLLPKTPKLDLSRLTPKSVQKISALPSAAARSYTALAQAFGITKFAEGGIVNKPMMGLVGEAGPEAIIPLSGRNSGLGNTFNITVNAGIGTDGAAVGRVIVDAIKKFERTSGPVFASA